MPCHSFLVHSCERYCFSFGKSFNLLKPPSALNLDTEPYLGVGSIFERRLLKISSEINGLGGCIDRESVVNTPYGTYWADRNRKTFVYFDGKTILEINNNLKSYFIKWNDKGIKGVFDTFSKNIYWTNGDWTISFKSELKDWVSYHDWIPDYFINTNFLFLIFL